MVFRIILTLLISCLVNYFFSFSHEFLIPLVALLVFLSPVGNASAVGFRRYLLVVLFILLVSLFFSTRQHLYARIYDASMGAVIGLLINIFIFPQKADAEFRKAILPIFIAYENYFSSMINFLLGKSNAIETDKIKVELLLQKFPMWVYHKSFDPGLKRGHQYFLGKMQQMAEILFAMHLSIRHLPERKILKKLRAPLLECVSHLQTLFKALVTVFELKKLSEGVEDCQPELYELEKTFQTLLPHEIDLMQIPPDLLDTYEFIYTLKDLRNALIKLAQALR